MEIAAGLSPDRRKQLPSSRLSAWLVVTLLIVAMALPARAQTIGFLFEFGSPGSDPGQFRNPQAVTVGANGNIVIVDFSNTLIQICDASNLDNVICEVFGTSGTDPGQFNSPRGVTIDGPGNIVLADGGSLVSIPGGDPTRFGNDRVQICDASNVQNVTCATFGIRGNAPGEFNVPLDVAVDGDGNIVVADGFNNRIQICDVSNLQSVTCGVFGSEGSIPGQFLVPDGVAVDGDGNIIVADTGNSRIQICDVSDLQNVACETFGSEGSDPGQFSFPSDVTVDGNGKIVVADRVNDRIQICDVSDLDNVVCEVFGVLGNDPGQFDKPTGVAVDGAGNIVVADTRNDRIQVLGPDTDGDGLADGLDLCPFSVTASPVNVNGVPTTVANILTTTNVPSVSNSGPGCTLQDIINQAAAPPVPCTTLALRRSVALAIRSLLEGGDLSAADAAALRAASFEATCPGGI